MTRHKCLPSVLRKPEVVGSKDGFWLSGAILLDMALVVGIARPFARPQVNALQTSCFACAWAVEKPRQGKFHTVEGLQFEDL